MASVGYVFCSLITGVRGRTVSETGDIKVATSVGLPGNPRANEECKIVRDCYAMVLGICFVRENKFSAVANISLRRKFVGNLVEQE